MAANRFILPFAQSFTATTGAVGVGWKLYFYLASAPSTPEDTFSDTALTSANSNPMIADSNGRFANIFMSPVAYNVVLTDENDVVQATATPFEVSPHLAGDITYTAVGVGTIARTLEAKLNDSISVKDFGMVGDGVTDDTAAFALAMGSVRNLYVPNGTYLITSQVTRTIGNLTMIGESKGGVRFVYTAVDDTAMLLIKDSGSIISNVLIQRVSFSGNDVATGGAIEAEDNSDFSLVDVFMEDFSAQPTTNFGVKLRGREFIRIHKFTTKDITKSVLFLDNPNAPTLDNDIVHISDIYLNVSDNVNGIGLDFQGTDNTSIVLDGQNSIAVCFHGIRVQNTSVTDSVDLRFSNLRVEQSDTAFARGVLTLTGLPLDTKTVTIGAKIYTFQTALTNVDGNVFIGASASDALDNLSAAMNLTAGAGTAYAAATTAHPDAITAQPLDGDVLGVGGGTSGIQATTTTLTNGAWGQTTLKTADDVGYGIYIDQPATSKLQNLTIDNVRVSHDNNGIYLRNVRRCMISNTSIAGGYGHYSLNVDNSCDKLIFQSFNRPAEGTELNSGLSDLILGTESNGIEIWDVAAAIPISASQGVNLQSALNYQGARTVTAPLFNDRLSSDTLETIVNNGTAATLPFPDNVMGFGTIMAADLITGTLAHGQFFFDGLGNTLVQTGNLATTNTQGTGASLNIYQIANQIRIENKLGVTVKVVLHGMYYSDAQS